MDMSSMRTTCHRLTKWELDTKDRSPGTVILSKFVAELPKSNYIKRIPSTCLVNHCPACLGCFPASTYLTQSEVLAHN